MRDTLALFPIAKRSDGQCEPAGEFVLSEPQPGSYGLHIDSIGHYNLMGLAKLLPARVCQRLFEPVDNLLTAHVVRTLLRLFSRAWLR
jgi:hypothetical protein